MTVVDNFFDLVRIDSPSGQESDLAVFLKNRLEKLGLTVDIDSAGNLFSRVPGPDPVLINAHMDTVEPGRGIRPLVSDGIISSDGTTILGADNKSALAAILTAIEDLGVANLRPSELVFSVQEETEGGISSFDFSRLSSRQGLVADRATPLGGVVLASPWILNLKINIIGRSAHASLPQDAVNALTVAAAAITRTKWGRINSKTTANIGLISGGSAMNTIPGSVSITGEVRSFSEKNLWETNARTQEAFTAVAGKFSARLDYQTSLYCPGYTYRKSDPAVVAVVRTLRSLGIKERYEVAFGASDANTFAAHGISLVNISDGGRDPHTVTENISVTDLKSLTEIFKSYLHKNLV